MRYQDFRLFHFSRAYVSAVGMMGAPGVGLLSGVNQSVEQVGRISTVLQMASEVRKVCRP